MSQSQYAPKKSGGGKSILIVIIVVLVVAVLAGAGWYVFFSSTPEKTVNTFLEATKKGDAKTAKALLSSNTSTSSFAADLMAQENRDIKFTVGTAIINGKTAEVPITISMPVPKEAQAFFGKQDISMEVGYGLVKESWRWKIDEQETDKVMTRRMGDFMPGGDEMPARPGR